MSDADYRSWVEVLPSFDKFNGAVGNGVTAGITQGFAQQSVSRATSVGSAGISGIISGALSSAGSAGGAGAARGIIASLGAAAGPIGAAIAAIGIVSGISDAITTAVKVGLDAGINYIQTSVSLAADLEQNVGAVTAIFKENADQIEAWSLESAEALGLSRNSYLSYSAVVGAQLKNLGIPFDEVAGKTNDLITLGADLAAQFGGTTSDAVTALSALLRGERDPIERYGVSIKQSAINARVAAMGLGDLTLEEQRQAEIVATLGILYEQTADSQGTFSREHETFLNVQQRTQASLEDTATELGQQLLPVLTEVLNFIKDDLVPIWEEFNAKVGPELKESLEKMWPKLADLIERLLPLLEPYLTGSIMALGLFLDQTTAVVTGLDRFVAAVSGVVNIFLKFFGVLDGDKSTETWFSKANQQWTDWAVKAKEFVGDVISTFTGFGQTLKTTIGNIAEGVFAGGQKLIQRFIDGIKSKVEDVSKAVTTVMDSVAGFFPHSPAERGPFAGSGWSAVAGAGRAVMDQFASGLIPVDVPLGFSTGLSVPTSASPRAAAAGESENRYAQIDPSQMRELLDAFKVSLFTQDQVIATSAGKGTGFAAALGAA